MGKVFDEETGNSPTCIYCNSEGECPHLVAVIDRTFLDCYGGELYDVIGNIKDKVSSLVTAQYLARDDFEDDSKDYELEVIIQDAIKKIDPEYPEDLDIDDTMFLTWLIEALKNAGADEPWMNLVEEGGPGQSSAMTKLYASDPKQVISDIKKNLDKKIKLYEAARDTEDC